MFYQRTSSYLSLLSWWLRSLRILIPFCPSGHHSTDDSRMPGLPWSACPPILKMALSMRGAPALIYSGFSSSIPLPSEFFGLYDPLLFDYWMKDGLLILNLAHIGLNFIYSLPIILSTIQHHFFSSRFNSNGGGFQTKWRSLVFFEIIVSNRINLRGRSLRKSYRVKREKINAIFKSGVELCE